MWSQVRFGSTRAVALLIGIVVAAAGFTVLTAASRSSQLRTVGTVQANFRAAYDILVRPKGATSAAESASGTVAPNFLSGIYGGISFSQYRKIQQIPGVDVAAPIAMIGYSLPAVEISVRLPAAALTSSRQLYRVVTTWVSANGTSRVPQPPTYVYITTNPLTVSANGSTIESLPAGTSADVCPIGGKAAGPFDAGTQSSLWCWSTADGLGTPGSEGFQNLSAHHPGFTIEWTFPMLIAAVDPLQEAKLDGLDQAVTSGAYLGETAGASLEAGAQGTKMTTFPVLASADSGIGEYSITQVQKLAAPTSPPTLGSSQLKQAATAAGQTVMTTRIASQDAYRTLLREMAGGVGFFPAINEFWDVGPVSYRDSGDRATSVLTPAKVANPASVWTSSLTGSGFVPAPMDNAGTQYRMLTETELSQKRFQDDVLPFPIPRLVGQFDQAKIEPFDPLSEVPLGPFQPSSESPANGATEQALGPQGLLPSLNLGGYVSQPPQLLTTLAAVPTFENSSVFSGDLHANDPISVIRVRVADITGPDPVSLERVREVAQQIAVRTNLDVDIVTGSSPTLRTIALAGSRSGQPNLLLSEKWVKKGVVVAIFSAVDKKSAALFGLILVVCSLFAANSATAAVRSRRQELGILACLGWTRSRIYLAVLGELVVIGAAAGIIGALLALPLSESLSLPASPARAAMAVPVAIALAVAAGTVPAWLASRAEPAAATRPQVATPRRPRQARSVSGMALVNVLRSPGRSLIAAFTLAVGVAGLTVLSAVTLAFRGVVVGSLLGNAVAIQIRGVDYLAVAAVVALGALAIADMMALNIRQRAPEIATLRSFGWTDSTLSRLMVTEAAIVAAAGSLSGAALGLAAAGALAQSFPSRLVAVAACAALGATAISVVATVLPTQLLRHLPTARLLGED